MAITGLDSIYAAKAAGKSNKGVFQKTTVNAITSAAGRWHEFFTANGIPAAGGFSGTAGVATVMNGGTQGALNVGTSSVSPDIRLATALKIQSPMAAIVPTTMYLVDYLLYYPSCVVTGSPTTLNNAATLSRYTSGDGVFPIISVQTVLGATQPSLTLKYTDSDGGTGNTALVQTSPVASAPLSTLFLNNGNPFVNLSGTARGVRKIDSYTLATGTTGTVAISLVKVIAEIDIYAANTGNLIDFLSGSDILPKIEDDACLGFMGVCGGAMLSNSAFSGTLSNVWG